MPIPKEEIKKLIISSIPDANIEIKDLMGDRIIMPLQLSQKCSGIK